MVNIIIMVVLGLIGVAFYFKWSTPESANAREKYLKEMENMLEAKCEPVSGQDNCFVINFIYDGGEYSYEDIEEKGLESSEYKAFVRAKKQDGFILEFTEKQKKKGVKSEIFIASEAYEGEVEQTKEIDLPKALEGFGFYCNDHGLLQGLMEDAKVVKILSEFVNKDAMGFLNMSLKFDSDAVVIDFASSNTAYPNIHMIKTNISALEIYVEKLSYLVNKLKELSTQE